MGPAKILEPSHHLPFRFVCVALPVIDLPSPPKAPSQLRSSSIIIAATQHYRTMSPIAPAGLNLNSSVNLRKYAPNLRVSNFSVYFRKYARCLQHQSNSSIRFIYMTIKIRKVGGCIYHMIPYPKLVVITGESLVPVIIISC
jgi:hypothetical protein